MGIVESSLQYFPVTKTSIDYIGNDIDDYKSILNIKKIVLNNRGISNTSIINASFRNLRINIYKINKQRSSIILPIIDTKTYYDYLEARDSLNLLRERLSNEEWIILINWFFGNKSKKFSKSQFYNKVKVIKEKCKKILGGNYYE